MDFDKKVSVIIGSYDSEELAEIITRHLENGYYIQDSNNQFYCGDSECVYVFVKKEYRG